VTGRVGLFITFEGVEGSGKSTLMSRLATGLEAAGHTVTRAREPGTTQLGDSVRALVLDPAHAATDPWAELFLMLAARAQLVRELVKPTLDRGGIVLCDRYGDASVAYQGAGRGLGMARVAELNLLATGGLRPDLTLLVDLAPALGRQRMLRPLDRLEAAPETFHRAVREAYLGLAAAEPARFALLDGAGSPDTVAQAAWSRLGRLVAGLPAALPD
jgi:dTMP kinase